MSFENVVSTRPVASLPALCLFMAQRGHQQQVCHVALTRLGQRNVIFLLGQMSTHRHIPRIRAPTLMRTPWFAAYAGAPAARGQLVLSNKLSKPSGMNRVREA
jgi:hypothetical protein